MTIESSGDNGWMLLLIALAIQWLIIWSAVRVATGRLPGSDPIQFVARTAGTPEGLALSLENRGTAAAVNLTVRWQGQAEDASFLSTLLLAPAEKIEAIIAPWAADDPPRVGMILVRHMSVAGMYRVERFAVLASPSTPDAAIIAPLAPTGLATNT